jgi:hypothetical protein
MLDFSDSKPKPTAIFLLLHGFGAWQSKILYELFNRLKQIISRK